MDMLPASLNRCNYDQARCGRRVGFVIFWTFPYTALGMAERPSTGLLADQIDIRVGCHPA
jgi:hypothetical protein